jgi:hypothetical protein
MNYKKLATAFVLLSIVCFNGQTQTGNYQFKNVTPPPAPAASPAISPMSTTEVYISNPTDNTYYLTFYNTATFQYYYETVNPWANPIRVLPVGTYNITVTSAPGAYSTWMYFVNYMTWGTSGYFAGVPLSGPWINVGFGD